jgi:hypothetical protein
MNATVIYVRTLLVFPRSNKKTKLLVSAPPISVAAVTGLDGSRKRTLRKGSNIFFRFVKPSKKYPDILTLDGHYSHSRNIEVIDCAREDRVHNVFLPQRSIHKLQPLGVSFMQPVKTYHAQVSEIWL